MEEEVKAGIDKFKAECARLLPGVSIVIPVRPTGANFLISFTYQGHRTYRTIHEDDFADWGEADGISDTLTKTLSEITANALSSKSTA